MIKLGAIGCGNMANAIIRGAKKGMGERISFFGYDIDKEKTSSLSDVGLSPVNSSKELVESSDYILFSVKPQNFSEMFNEIKGADLKGKVFISIAAGITAKAIKEALCDDVKVVLVMPNTPLLLGQGATAMARVEPTTKEEFSVVKEIFSCAGTVCEIPSDKLPEVIPVNGSSPAFLYEFAKGFIKYGADNGIGEETSLKLFCQAMRGAADMMEHSGKSIDELITMVSSKGGTTIEGLKGLAENNLQKAIADCCEKCVKRAYELSEEKRTVKKKTSKFTVPEPVKSFSETLSDRLMNERRIKTQDDKEAFEKEIEKLYNSEFIKVLSRKLNEYVKDGIHYKIRYWSRYKPSVEEILDEKILNVDVKHISNSRINLAFDYLGYLPLEDDFQVQALICALVNKYPDKWCIVDFGGKRKLSMNDKFWYPYTQKEIDNICDAKGLKPLKTIK